MAKTIKQLAQECNVSYEAIRKSVNAFMDDLEGHTYKEFKTLYLDDYACEFIKNKRMANPVIVQQVSASEELIALKEKYTQLLECHNDLQTEYRNYMNNTNDLLLTASKQVALAEQSEANQKKAKDLEEKVQKVSGELTKASDELTAIKNKWWYKLFAGKKGKE